jgi:MFS family permease
MSKRINTAGKRLERARREDMITNRILVIFLAAFAVMAGLMVVNRFYHASWDSYFATRNTLFVLTWVFAAAGFAAVVMAFVSLGNPKRAKLFGGLAVPILFLAGGCLLMAVKTENGVRIMYAILPAVAVLYLIFYTYQREFLCIAALTGAGTLTLWLMRTPTVITLNRWLIPSLALSGIAVLAFALTYLRGKGGILKAGRNELRVFPSGTKYRFMYAACGLVAVAVLLASLLGGAAAFYLIFVLVGLLFIAAVYYTVKMM